jgi:hypothetical protein
MDQLACAYIPTSYVLSACGKGVEKVAKDNDDRKVTGRTDLWRFRLEMRDTVLSR